MAIEGLQEHGGGLGSSGGPGHDHDVPAAEVNLPAPEAFAAKALESIPRDRVTRCLDRNGQAQPCVGKGVGQTQDDEFRAAASLTLGAYGRVLAGPREPVRTGKRRAVKRTGAQSDRQSMATLSAAGFDDKLAVLRRHAGSEAMSPFAAQFAGLIGSFHGNRPCFDNWLSVRGRTRGLEILLPW